MEFFYRLTIKEGIMYFFDMQEMVKAEMESMQEAASKPTPQTHSFDPNMFQSYQQWKNF
jgi:hypothetical protein